MAIKKAKLNLLPALRSTEKTKKDIALNVTALFLNIVLDKEAIAIYESKNLKLCLFSFGIYGSSTPISFTSRRSGTDMRWIEYGAAAEAHSYCRQQLPG